MSDDYLADAIRRAQQHRSIVNSEGWDAAARGLPVSACPYPYNSDDGRAWTRAWTERRDIHERTTGGYDQRHTQARALFAAEGHARAPKQTAFDKLMAEIDDATRPDPPRHDHSQCPFCADEHIHPVIPTSVPPPLIHVVLDQHGNIPARTIDDIRHTLGSESLDHQERLT